MPFSINSRSDREKGQKEIRNSINAGSEEQSPMHQAAFYQGLSKVDGQLYWQPSDLAVAYKPYANQSRPFVEVSYGSAKEFDRRLITVYSLKEEQRIKKRLGTK